MSDIKIGQIIKGIANRDAIHMAIAPVVAYERLTPGSHVGFINGKAGLTGADNTIGIVDPFLKEPVKPGDTFWLFLYPGSIKGLRHEWTHLAFEEENAKAAALISDWDDTAECRGMGCD